MPYSLEKAKQIVEAENRRKKCVETLEWLQRLPVLGISLDKVGANLLSSILTAAEMQQEVLIASLSDHVRGIVERKLLEAETTLQMLCEEDCGKRSNG